MKKIKNLKEQFINIDKIKIFEIEVIDKRTGQQDYIIFDISLNKNTLIAQHVALNTKQEKSKKISFVKSVLDNIYSIDENLQNLHENCINAILNSQFYELI